jgi:hypothetical protein
VGSHRPRQRRPALEKAIGQRGKTKWEKDTKAHPDRRITLDPDTVELLREHKARCAGRAAALHLKLKDDSFVFSLAPDGSTHLVPDSVTQRYGNLARRQACIAGWPAVSKPVA